jgi:hypothetical protein
MEAFRSYADVQVLTLGVAAEYLIKRTFPDIATVDKTFAKEVADLQKELEKMSLGERLKSRIFGSLGKMLEPSPYEIRSLSDCRCLRITRDYARPSSETGLLHPSLGY